MRILYDDRELIEHLKAENASLRAQVAEFKESFHKLEVALTRCEEAIRVPNQARVAERRPLTAWNGVPMKQALDVDWERMGLQPPPESRR